MDENNFNYCDLYGGVCQLVKDITADRDRLQAEVERLKEKESLSESMMDAMTRLIDKQAEEIKAITARCNAAEGTIFELNRLVDFYENRDAHPNETVVAIKLGCKESIIRWLTLKNKED